MSDLIRRQYVVDHYDCGDKYGTFTNFQSILEFVNSLPSEEPEIIHCWECRFGEVDDPCFPDQYFCCHHGCDWNNGNHYCGYAERREVSNEPS